MRYGGKLPGRMDQLPQLIYACRLQHVLVKASSIAAFNDSRSAVAANGNQEKGWQVGTEQFLCRNKAVLCRHCDVYQNQVWTRAPSMVNAFRGNLARRHVTAEPFQVFAKEIYGVPLISDDQRSSCPEIRLSIGRAFLSHAARTYKEAPKNREMSSGGSAA